MPTGRKQKRKAFGTSPRNESVNHHLATTARKRADSRVGDGKENEPRPMGSSKTPKTSNLTTIGGAYGLGDDFGMNMNPTRKKKSSNSAKIRGAAAAKKPDPSPLKKPDPTSQTQVVSSKQPETNSVKSIVSMVLKRNKSDHSKTGFAGEVTAFSSALAMSPPANEQLDGSDMDTACSTPEKESPLVISPRNRPDPPVHSISVTAGRERRLQKEPIATEPNAAYDRNEADHEKKRPAFKLTALKNHCESNRYPSASKHHPSKAPMAPLKKKGDEDADTRSCVDVAINHPMCKQVNNKKVKEAMLNSGKYTSEASRVVGSFVGGSSLQRSNSEDISEMTMIDEQMSNTSMTTLGGNPCSQKKKKSLSSSSKIFRQSENENGIPSSLHLQRVDLINSRHANVIENETIVSRNTYQRKPSDHLRPLVDSNNSFSQSYLPAGWKECFSKTKKRPFYKHPDLGTTWFNPGFPMTMNMNGRVTFTNINATQSAAFKESPKSHESLNEYRADDESIAKNSATNEFIIQSTNEFTIQQSTKDHEIPQEEELDDLFVASTPNQPDEKNSSFQSIMSVTSHQSKQTSSNTKRISEDYQKLLAPYQSVEKSVASRQASSYGDISSKCLTQEFIIKKDDKEAASALGTPSIGNSIGVAESENGGDPVEFDDCYEEEDDLMNDRQASDMNTLSSDHVDVDALLARCNHEYLMSTIRENLYELESATEQTPSSVVSMADFGNDDDDEMSHQGSDDGKSLSRISLNSNDGTLSQESEPSESSSHETSSKSAIKDANANAGKTLNDDDLIHDDNYDNGQSPLFKRFDINDATDSDDEVEDSQRQSKRNRAVINAMNLPFEHKQESTGSSGYIKRRFFPPGPLCSLQFLDEIDAGEFDTPLWRRMKRKRSTFTSVKRGKAEYRANMLRQPS